MNDQTPRPGEAVLRAAAAQHARDAQREIEQLTDTELAAIAEAGDRQAQAAPRTQATLQLIHAGQLDSRRLAVGAGPEGGFWADGEGFWEQAARAACAHAWRSAR
jgi:hypothetical protein